jgi:putative FmdB family regulatory protein
MPTYSYRCATCRHQFDIFQRFSDNALTECPECQGQLKKVLHPVGVVFKGSGWYVTDSRKTTGSENGGIEKSDKTDAKDGKDGKASETAKKTETADTTASSTKAKATATSES